MINHCINHCNFSKCKLYLLYLWRNYCSYHT